MEYTLNEEQIKFLEALLGGMDNEEIEHSVLIRHTEEDAKEVIEYIKKEKHFDLYRDLEDLIRM